MYYSNPQTYSKVTSSHTSHPRHVSTQSPSHLPPTHAPPSPPPGGGPRAPNSALPIGAVSVADPLRLANLPASTELIQSLLAVSHAASPDLILSSNVAGFILVKDVDTARGLVTYTAPCPGHLPGRYLVTGSLRSSLD